MQLTCMPISDVQKLWIRLSSIVTTIFFLFAIFFNLGLPMMSENELQEICWSAVLGICHLCTVEGENIFRPEASRVPRDDSKFRIAARRIPPKYAVCAAYLEQKDCNVVCC
jgi:hypothetical protein